MPILCELTNHLWQSTLFAAAAGLLTLALRRNRAQVRFWLWFGASVKFLLPFALLIGLVSQMHPAAPESPIAMPALSSAVAQISEPFPAGPGLAPLYTAGSWLPTAALGLWTAGFVTIVFARLRAWRIVRSTLRGVERVEAGAAGRVEIRMLPGLLEPGVIGIFRPILLLPAGIADHLTPTQLSAVIAHELCHVRRRDNLFAAIHMLVEAVFWFHPLVWWIGARMVEERERACDEDVLRSGNAPRDYAEGILNVCKVYLESPLTCVSGVTGASLKKRIEAIMTNRVGRQLNTAGKLILAAIGMAALVWPLAIGIGRVATARAQAPSEKPLAFEAASIKPIAEPTGGRRGPGGGNMQITPERGRVYARAVTTRGIIREAYRMVDGQISGGPSWLDSDWYTVEAKAAAATSGPELRRMLRTLLAERFHFAAHRDSKTMPVYILTVGKSGLKVPELKPDEPTPTHIPHRTAEPGPAMMMRATMQDFAYFFSRDPMVDRIVIDKTGVGGTYFFGMQWGEDEDFLAVMQQQFGLKLEAQKASVDTVVIDRIDKPDAN